MSYKEIVINLRGGIGRMNRIPIKNQQVISRSLEGETIILNPMTGTYFGLNMVSFSFWEYIDGTRTLDQIKDILLEEYDVEKEELHDDILALTQDLADQDLITFRA